MIDLDTLEKLEAAATPELMEILVGCAELTAPYAAMLRKFPALIAELRAAREVVRVTREHERHMPPDGFWSEAVKALDEYDRVTKGGGP